MAAELVNEKALVGERIATIRERIAAACARAGRDPKAVKILAATKGVDPARIEEAMAAGITLFGENRLQEALPKLEQLGRRPGVEWHFLGHVQTNKARKVAALFDAVQSVDSRRVAEALEREARRANKKLKVLIEVNIGGEANKFGVAPAELPELARFVGQLEHLRLCGLMAIPPRTDSQEEARPFFKRMRELAREIEGLAIPGLEMVELSMGMSGDFEAAVEEGATMVRLGTAIFGLRPD